MSKQIEWFDGVMESTVSVGPWFARATSSDWAVFLDGVGKVRGGTRQNRVDGKIAVIDAFDELRVSLTVEDGQ